MPDVGPSFTLENWEEERIVALKSWQFKLSMQNKDTDGMEKQILDSENGCSDHWMLSGEKKWGFESAFGKYILRGKS